MNRTDIVIGFAILVVLVGGFLVLKSQSTPSLENIPYPSSTPVSIQSKIESQFNVNIPADVQKAELKDTTGGTASAIATRDYKNNTYSLTILADLPDPASGEFYQAWIYTDIDKPVSLGKLSIAKGGWMFEYQSKNDYSKDNNVLITLEKTFDQTPETHILEGSF